MSGNDIINFADKIAELCYKHYSKLGKSGKPIKGKEWTLLSCIVKLNKIDNSLSVVSLATGSKCIGSSLMSPNGIILNDSHAEVLARRCFLHYLYHQIQLIKNGNDSDILQVIKNNKFMGGGDNNNIKIKEHYEIKSNVTFHLFTSQVPCGDASIFLIKNNSDYVKSMINCIDNDNEKQSNIQCDKLKTDNSMCCGKKRKFDVVDCDNMENNDKVIKIDEHSSYNSSLIPDNSSWNMSDSIGDIIFGDENDVYRTGAKCVPDDPRQDIKGERFDHQVVGAVRTKPGRGEPTLSVSCSDKIARWIAIGIQGAVLSLLIEKPIHLSSIIIGGGGPYSKESLYRAVIERTKTNQKPDILHTNLIFEMSKYSPDNIAANRPCPAAVTWTDVPERSIEVAVQGLRQGTTKKSKDKGSLRICKRELFKLFIKLTDSLFINNTYKEVKLLSKDYQNNWTLVKKNLGAWTVKPTNMYDFIISSDELK